MVSIENFANAKITYTSETSLVLSIIYSKCENKDEKYATKADLKNATDVDTSETDKLDIGKLKTTPVDYSKLSNLVKNEVVENFANAKITYTSETSLVLSIIYSKCENKDEKYATKADLKNATDVDTSETDKLDIGKLKTTPVDYSKLSNLVKNEVVEKVT